MKKVDVLIEQDEDGVFIGSISTIPSCYAEGGTQKEMLKNLKQVKKLCTRNNKNTKNQDANIKHNQIA
ncbi:MAG: hypothetical protein ACD_76C00007G0006 [uncultured bacterium]|nr:MAG: hypothetical protein ACD_76C00007G0006 [uncultured bacterium]HBD05081.1 hypothetical protein [Candidatus Uhrbacteria bacterium]